VDVGAGVFPFTGFVGGVGVDLEAGEDLVNDVEGCAGVFAC
jgi:hypothetical protein